MKKLFVRIIKAIVSGIFYKSCSEISDVPFTNIEKNKDDRLVIGRAIKLSVYKLQIYYANVL